MARAHENTRQPERRPMPAFREPEARKDTIVRIVGVLLSSRPELTEDLSQLTASPLVNERAIDEGYGPYGHDTLSNIWNHLAVDVIPTIDELRDATDAMYLEPQPS